MKAKYIAVFIISMWLFFCQVAYCQLWKQYLDTANMFSDQNKTAQSLEYYMKSRSLLTKDSSGTLTYAECCSKLTYLYFDAGQYKKAEPLLYEVKEIKEKLLGKNTPEYAICCNNLGMVYMYLGQLEKAESFTIEAMSIREKVLGKDHPHYALSCNNLALIYQETGQYKKAEPLFLHAKSVWEKTYGRNHSLYATCCDNLASIYTDMDQFEKAEPLYIEAKQIREALVGKNHPEYARSCGNLAVFYERISQYDKAKALLLEERQVIEKTTGKNYPGYIENCNNLAVIYHYLGENEKAEALYVEAKKLREDMFGKDHPDHATDCINLAELYKDIGQYKKAEMLFLEAKQTLENSLGKNHPRYAISCNNLADFYMIMGQYEKSESLFLEAQQIREKAFGKNHSDYASSCNNLAELYEKTGLYEKAELLHIEAKQITENILGKYNPNHATDCNNLAKFYMTMGQYEKAESLFLEAKQVREDLFGKNHPDYASSCNNLAELYKRMGKYEKAEPLYIEAKQIRENKPGKTHPEYAQSCNNLALLYQQTNRLEKAEPLLIEAKEVWGNKLGHQHPIYAIGCNNLGKFYLDRAQYDKAEPLLLEAKKIRENIGGKNTADYIGSCNNLFFLNWQMNRPLTADSFLTESFNSNISLLNKVFGFTNETEKSTYINRVSGTGSGSNYYSFYLSAFDHNKAGNAYDISLFNRNLVLVSGQSLKRAIYTSTDTLIQNKYEKWIALKKQLASLYSSPAKTEKKVEEELEQKAGNLEKELTRISTDFKKQQEQYRTKWGDIQRNLLEKEAAIEFIEFRYNSGKRITDSIYYAALLLKKDIPEPVLVPLFEKRQLSRLLAASENKDVNNNIKKLYSRGVIVGNQGTGINDTSLYNIIWKPLEQQLGGIQKIYFAPAGLLHKIAFAAMQLNKDSLLSDRHQLVQLNTTAAITNQQPYDFSSSGNILLYGGINYDTDSILLKSIVAQFKKSKNNSRSFSKSTFRGEAFSYLPGTQEEIHGIKQIAIQNNISISSLSGNNATEESFKALEGDASPQVIHIATHGFFFPDPKQEKKDSIDAREGKVFKESDNPLLRSGLLFAGANNTWHGKPVQDIEDGILTGYEVSNMYLPNTKLVILSACETGLGDIQGAEGVYGLQRAFKMAGVQNLVMSLWKVPDYETAEFMQELYKNLLNKQAITEAFNIAQTTMKNKYRDNPYKWAAWILIK